tara:strand:- start:357 stop:557 length:201 start_codon:yes stop_codon:yes gene_type:complete
MVLKCSLCNKKLKNVLIEITGKCRCGEIFCREHISNHNCTFNYKKLYEKEKKNELIVIKKAKVEKI